MHVLLVLVEIKAIKLGVQDRVTLVGGEVFYSCYKKPSVVLISILPQKAYYL